MGGDGNISKQGTFEELKLNGSYESTVGLLTSELKHRSSISMKELEETKAVDTAAQPGIKSEHTDLEVDSTRRTGDLSIYLYYVQAVGWIPTVVFLVCITCYVFGISFPSTLFLRQPQCGNCLQTLNKDIWVKWWAQANSDAPNQNLGYWLGIYGLLGAVALICLVLSCWWALLSNLVFSFHAKSPLFQAINHNNGAQVRRKLSPDAAHDRSEVLSNPQRSERKMAKVMIYQCSDVILRIYRHGNHDQQV